MAPRGGYFRKPANPADAKGLRRLSVPVRPRRPLVGQEECSKPFRPTPSCNPKSSSIKSPTSGAHLAIPPKSHCLSRHSPGVNTGLSLPCVSRGRRRPPAWPQPGSSEGSASWPLCGSPSAALYKVKDNSSSSRVSPASERQLWLRSLSAKPARRNPRSNCPRPYG